MYVHFLTPFCGKIYVYIKYPKEQNFIKMLLRNIIFMLLNEIIMLPSVDQTCYNMAKNGFVRL